MQFDLSGYDPPGPPAERRAPAHLSRTVIIRAILNALPMLLLVNMEVWAAVAILVWAVGGMLQLGRVPFLVAAAALCLLGLFTTAATLRLAVVNRNDI